MLEVWMEAEQLKIHEIVIWILNRALKWHANHAHACACSVYQALISAPTPEESLGMRLGLYMPYILSKACFQ